MTKPTDSPTWRLKIVALTLFGALSFIPSSTGSTGRHPRDLTGQYHGDHSHNQVHDHSADSSSLETSNRNLISNVGTPLDSSPLAPHCLCVVKDTGCLGREAYTRQFDGISTLVCGLSFERCCFEDPWPGVVDQWADKAPCIPQEVCPRWYGQGATDVRDFGVMGPCPGFGAVRCLSSIVTSEDVTLDVGVPPPPQVETPQVESPPKYDLPAPPVETAVVPIVPQPQPPAPVFFVPLPPPPPVPAPIFLAPLPPPVPAPIFFAPAPVPVPVPAPLPPARIEPPVTPLVAPLPPFSRPGPPYLWKNFGYGFPFGWGKGFSFRKRIGFGYGFY